MKRTVWQEGMKEQFKILHKMDTSYPIKTMLSSSKFTNQEHFFSFAAMGRWPKINHTQLQGQQCQSDDMPQETVSFVCFTPCSWLLSSKGSEWKMRRSVWPGSVLFAFPSTLLASERKLTRAYLHSSRHLAGHS